MTRSKWMLLGVVLVLTAGMVGVLQRAKSLHRLGRPGLKLIQQPVYDVKTNLIGTTTVALPASVLGLRSRTMPISQMEVDWLPKDTTFARRLYEGSNAPAMLLNVILMGTDRGSIHQPQICLTGQGWKIEKAEPGLVRVAQPVPYDLPVMKMTAGKRVKTPDGRQVDLRSLYVYWFVADGQLTARHGERMWWMARDLLLTGTLQRWAYVACWSQCLPGQEEATYEVMKRFLGAAVPEFQLTHPGPAQGKPLVPTGAARRS
jgi:hypothetical protein